MRRTRTLLVIATLAASVVACGQQSDDNDYQPEPTSEEPAAKMDVGVANDMPGLSLANGYTYSGFDVDLYQWLGLHSTPAFTPVSVPLPVSARVTALESGRVDMVVDAFSITDKRRESILFAGPYLITKQGVMVKAGDKRITNLTELEGKHVCTLAGSTSLQQINESSMHERVLVDPRTGIKECVDDLRVGKVDAVSTDQLILYGFAKQDPANLSVVKNAIFGADERYGVGVPKGEVQLCEELSAKIKQFVIDGRWKSAFDEHFGGINLTPDLYKPNPYDLDPCTKD